MDVRAGVHTGAIDSVPLGMSCTHLVSPTDSATEPAAAISRGEGVLFGAPVCLSTTSSRLNNSPGGG